MIVAIDSLTSAARAVDDLERAHAEGHPVDGWIIAECRSWLAKRTPGPKQTDLAARLDVLRPRADQLMPKSLKGHRAALAALELEVGALATGRVTGYARVVLVTWLEREIASEIDALDAKHYGASGEVTDARMTALLERAAALGIRTPFGPDTWRRWDRERAERQRRDEEFRRMGGSAWTVPPGDMTERDCLAAEFSVDPAAPADAIKRALRRLASRWHPDRPDGDGAVMVRVNRLRELLSTAGASPR
jgi:hypothetical protein